MDAQGGVVDDREPLQQRRHQGIPQVAPHTPRERIETRGSSRGST
jgi:hypothetical protein